MHHIRPILVLAFLLSLANAASAHEAKKQAIQALSAWTNQSGSTFYIDSVAPSGQLTGHYINRAQGYGCQNTAYPATGWIYGTAITFTVDWINATEACNSITSWTGFYYNGQITTLWQLVVNGSTSTSQIIQGSDVFKPDTQVKRKSLKLSD